MQLTTGPKTYRRKISPNQMSIDAIVTACMHKLDGSFTRIGLTFEPSKRTDSTTSVQKWFSPAPYESLQDDPNSGWKCTECGRHIPEEDVGEHLDEHVARKLQREWNHQQPEIKASPLKRPLEAGSSQPAKKKPMAVTRQAGPNLLNYFNKKA
jgi:hypothetical protein